MTEEEIANNLKQNIRPEPVAEVRPYEPVIDPNTGQATISPEYALDELVQYKLHDFFGEQYKPNDEVARQQIQYIYDKVSKMVDNPEYGFVVAKIRELERIVGTTNLEDRRYRLYQWLKLDSMRRNIDAQMGALTNG